MKVKIKIPDNSTIIHTHRIRKLKEENTTTFIGTTDDIDECVILIRKQIHTSMFKPITIFDIIYPEEIQKPKYVSELEDELMPKDEEEEIIEEDQEFEEEKIYNPSCPICKHAVMQLLDDGRYECCSCWDIFTKEQIENWQSDIL